MDDHTGALLRFLYIAFAAIAGAVTALGAVRLREMSRIDITLTLLTGFSFAIFVTPWVAHSVFGIDENNIRAVAGLTYLFGSGSNILLPVLIRKLRSTLGEGELK